MKSTPQNLYYTSAVIAGINFTAIASAKGITELKINPGDSHYSQQYTRLQEDDPWFYNIFGQLREYFDLKRTAFTVPLDLNGTGFQLKVWNILKEIPYGRTESYAWVSKKTGNMSAIRAVGRAAGSNPVPVIIPCHRVINSDGSLGGFSCGLEIKRQLLALEGALSLRLFG